MINILDTYLTVMEYWCIPSFIVGFIGVFILKSKYGGPRSRKTIIKEYLLIGQFFVTGITAFGVFWIIQSRARQELNFFLSQQNLIVNINHKQLGANGSEIIINELRRISNYGPHNSHSANDFKIQISSKVETITLTVGQDSEIKTEFWILKCWNAMRGNAVNILLKM